jgi:hypothetical protein
MAEVAISIHADDGAEFATTDSATVAKVRAALGPEASHLVPAHDLAKVLRGAGRTMWAATLEREEDAHVVRVVVSNH